MLTVGPSVLTLVLTLYYSTSHVSCLSVSLLLCVTVTSKITKPIFFSCWIFSRDGRDM